ncbi:MAG TPA: metallophosphoesterase, partial [Verrucomicrobiae bacterium]|nr:metallophosphoesterase [Verrucomicrobiae bacterium]
DAALEGIVQHHVQFLIVPGDLTKDGELADHLLIAQHLAKLERHGIQVFVVPGNHDINNPDAVAYRGDTTVPVRNVSPQLFRAIYQPFGYGRAIDHDKHSLSYLAEPVCGLWLLGIDSCKYDQNEQLGAPVVSGRIKPETMEWVARKMAEAKAHRKHVIAVMHHGLNQHFLGQAQIFPDFLVDDWLGVSKELAALGLNTVFTGHYHSQDAAFPLDATGIPQQTLCDVETGSLAMFPCAYRIVSIGCDGTLKIQTERVTQIKADTAGMAFQDYARDFLAARLPTLVTYQLMSMFQLPQDQAAQVAPLAAEALIANYAGDEMPSAQTQSVIGGFLASPEPLHTLGLMLGGLWTDLPPQDNHLELPLD